MTSTGCGGRPVLCKATRYKQLYRPDDIEFYTEGNLVLTDGPHVMLSQVRPFTTHISTDFITVS